LHQVDPSPAPHLHQVDNFRTLRESDPKDKAATKQEWEKAINKMEL
jgi:hypothetical protein